jgi:hypothetical protein
MECARCKAIGKQPKTYHYARNGRWRTIEKCPHQRQETRKGQVKRKRGPKINYTDEMDAFLLLHYPRDKRRYRRNAHIMDKMRDDFEGKFGLVLSKGQLIGRWHRLKGLAVNSAREETRGVPSLPVLKFMQDAGSDHA